MMSLWFWFAVIATTAAHKVTDSFSSPPPVSSLSPSQLPNSRKERFLLSVLKFHNTRCVETSNEGRRVEGVCQHRAECKYLRGNNLGTCAIFGACCAIERSCNNATSLKVAYFVSPPPGSDSYCDFRVEVTNRDVCQIRLDFEDFSLAQPTKLDPLNSFNPYECRTDAFLVKTLLTGTNNLPPLCGENTGQHLYVPVNNTQGGNIIALSFLLASRISNPRLVAPRWRIKVTQIECSGAHADYTMATSFSKPYSAAWNKQLPIHTDHLWRAPPGCLQYYTERFGTYETFNYMGGEGPYIGNLNYAICFRREADVCGIRHTPVSFSLSFNDDTNDYTNDDCDAVIGVDMPNQDYLYVTEGFTTTRVASKYCGTAVNSTNFITSVAPGPMAVFFRSDNINYPEQVNLERGFRINYEVLNSGC